MTNIRDYDVRGLCQRSLAVAIEKGWLETLRAPEDHTILMVSELSEGLEDYRKGFALTEKYYEDVEDTGGVPKPCGIPIEIADFAIRIAQYVGESEQMNRFVEVTSLFSSSKMPLLFDDEKTISFPRFHHIAMKQVAQSLVFWDSPLDPVALARAFVMTFGWAEGNGIDLPAAIAEKEAFNRLRGFKHGGKKI